MTKEKQLIVIAELDGFTDIREIKEGMFKDIWCGRFGSNLHETAIPQYLQYRDAIIPVIKNLNDETFAKFQSHLCQIIAREYNTLTHLVTFRMMFEATPAQIAEALLRATGKWEE